MTRHEQNRLARQRMRDVGIVDRTDPEQNPALRNAIEWAVRNRAARPRRATKFDFSPFTILDELRSRR